MSILSWLNAVTRNRSPGQEPMHFAEDEKEFHGLDMKAALDAHSAWTRRMEAKLEGTSDEPLEVADVAPDDLCTLGRWIHGPARQRFGGTEAFENLQQVHADFHLKAGEVLNDVLNDNREKAREGIKAIRHQSGAVQLALVKLYSQANQ